MSSAEVVGYWFRFGLNRRVLHVARWERQDDGSLLIVSACGLQVIDPVAPAVPERLILQPTAVAALRIMDGHQASKLCPKCRARFERRPDGQS